MSEQTIPETEATALLDQLRENFTLSYEGEKDQRRREEEDLQFQVPELQWDAAAKESRQGGTRPGGVVVLPRPMVSISKIDQPIRLVMDHAHDADLGINFHPVSEDADDKTAETLQDLNRRIDRDSDANSHRLWALDRAVKAGRGVYRVTVRPDEDGYRYGDLEIGVERFLHQGCVYFDPSAQLPDYSDGDFAWVTSWMFLGRAARKYPGTWAAKAAGDGISWESYQRTAPLWTRQNDAGKAVQVAECFYKKHRDIEVLILDNGQAIVDGSKIPRGAKVLHPILWDEVEVWRCVTNGIDILEKPTRWFGKYIPLIPVLGRELQPFDEQRRIIGIIRNARDPQRLFNTSASTVMERLFMEPRSPWMGPEGFDAGREAEWARANYDYIPVLHYKPTQYDDQTPHPAPSRTQTDPTGLQSALLALHEAAQLCQDATAFFDPSLGKTAKQQESGRKVLALQGQGDAANGDWLVNLAVAMRYEGMVKLDLIAPADKNRVGVYDAPGRITSVLGGENAKPRKIMLNRPYVVDPNTGKPRAAKDGQEGAKIHDLRSGARYGVSVDIGASYKTRLQEGDEAVGEIIKADPSLLGVIGDLWFQFKKFPGAAAIADRLTIVARGLHPEFFQDEEGSPEQIAAKAKAMEQQVGALSKQLEEAVQFVKTDQAKHEAQVQIEQFKAQMAQQTEAAKIQAQIQLAEMNNAAKLAIERLKLEGQAAIEANRLAEERLATGLKLAAEQDKTAVQADHERRMQMADHAHDVGMAAAGGHTEEHSREGGRTQDSERTDETSEGGTREASSESSAESQPQEATE